MGEEIIYKPITVFVGLDSKKLFKICKDSPNEFTKYDFPENNIHPWQQIDTIESICRNWNASHWKYAICTHSPYIIDHLVNLMKAFKSKNKDETAKLFRLKDKRCFLNQEDLAVYLVEGDSIKNILDKDGFIDWDTFSEVSDYVMSVRFDMEV